MFTLIPTLKCEQVNDRFTKNTMIDDIMGNAKLAYPVGLITTDEVAFAGAFVYLDKTYENLESYLYNETEYWSMTPSVANNEFVDAFTVQIGMINDGTLRNISGIRPVISFDATAITGGTGSIIDPFTVTSE